MSAAIDKLAKELKSQISASDDRKPKPYDAQAEVLRVEDGIAWVHIPGGVEETPVRLTINAKKGDMVNIHVANGSAWIAGNSTNPPTDDSTAIELNQKTSKNLFVLNEKVTNELNNAWTEITQNSEEIKLKASQETVNSLGERLSTAETNITQNAGQIALRATKTEVTDAKNAAIASANSTTDGKLAEYTKTADFSIAPDQIASVVSAKVGNDEVISKINQSAETIKIQASKVAIDGTATFNAIKSSTDAAYDAKGAASNAVDNLQIGGKNLIRYSMMRPNGTAGGLTFAVRTNEPQWIDITGTATENIDQWVVNLQSLTVTNATVTISANSVFSDSVNNYFYVSTSKDGAWYKDYKQITWYSSTERRLTINLENGETLRFIRLHLANGATISGGYRFKVELGNKQTDWSPAPEDVQADIDAKKSTWNLMSTSASGATYQAILGYAESTTTFTIDNSASGFDKATDVKVGDTVRLKYKATDMGSGGTYVYIIGKATQVPPTVADNKITLAGRGLDTTVIDGGHILTGTIDANKVNVSNLTVGSAQSGWGNVLNDNIEIGGRNLIRALDETKVTVNKLKCSYTYANGKYVITCTAGGSGSSFTQIYGETGAGALAFNGVSPGDTVIFHVDSVVSSNSASEPRIYLDMRKADGTYISSVGIYQSLNNWVNIFTIPAEAARYSLIVRLDQNRNAAIGDTLTVSGIKLEKGNKATDWTPAPEDVQNDIALSNRNMLLDWNASSLDKVDASSARYYGNNATGSAYITPTFIPINDAPEPSIKYGVRFVGNGTNTAVTSLTLCFYSAQNLTALPFKDGCKYTISFWARCTAGNSRISIMVRNGTAWEFLIPTSTVPTSEWKRYYGVLDYRTADYNRLHFYIYFDANKSGTVETCGFQCVANGDSAEATKYITAIDNNGIRVHAANNPTSNYAKIDASGMEVYKGGNEVAKFGQTIELSDGTRTLYEVKPLSGAAKVTRLYNLVYYDGYKEVENFTETVHLGRTVSSWSSIVLTYDINSTVYTKTYSSFPVSDASGKFTLDISYADSSNARVNVGINLNSDDNHKLLTSETLTIVSLVFTYNTTQTAIESTLGAYADKTQSAAFRVGNGISTNAESNSFSLDWAGNGYFNGDVYANCDANSSGGVSLGTVQYIPSAFNADTPEYHMDIGVFRIGMVVMLDMTFFRNKSIAAGGNVFNLDISRSEIPMPQTGVATGMAFYNNSTSSRALGIVLGDTDGTGPRIRVYNNGTNAVTISSTHEVHCTMTYICDTFTASQWSTI